MMFRVVALASFKKSFKRIKRRGKDLDKLKAIIGKLSDGQNLDYKHKDHLLTDSRRYRGCRECHIEPDWLLVYKLNKEELILVLVETGTHSDLF